MKNIYSLCILRETGQKLAYTGEEWKQLQDFRDMTMRTYDTLVQWDQSMEQQFIEEDGYTIFIELEGEDDDA